MDLMRIEPDKERAKSLLKLALLRFTKIAQFDIKTESSLIAESYYETAKELITALLFTDGHKTLSHKDLVEYLTINYADKFSESEINNLDSLRKRRNSIVYYGVFVDVNYIQRNKDIFEAIINKLKKEVERKTGGM